MSKSKQKQRCAWANSDEQMRTYHDEEWGVPMRDSRALGLKVTIEDRKGKGKVIIEYSGVADFDAILTALGQPPQ